MELTHASLCQLAVSWLKRPHSRQGPGCQVAITESKCGWLDGEIPDAIGFRAGVFAEASVLVECKLSRGDFLADKKNPIGWTHRKAWACTATTWPPGPFVALRTAGQVGPDRGHHQGRTQGGPGACFPWACS